MQESSIMEMKTYGMRTSPSADGPEPYMNEGFAFNHPSVDIILARATRRMACAVGLSLALMTTHCDRYDESDRSEFVTVMRTGVMIDQLAALSAWTGPLLTEMMPGPPKTPAVIIGSLLSATSDAMMLLREKLELWVEVVKGEMPEWD
jgi:hypothetical protein